MQTIDNIRVIKRSERDVQPDQTEAAREPVGAGQGQKEASPPAAVGTITGWINELRQKKHAELATALAFKNQLAQTA